MLEALLGHAKGQVRDAEDGLGRTRAHGQRDCLVLDHFVRRVERLEAVEESGVGQEDLGRDRVLVVVAGTPVAFVARLRDEDRLDVGEVVGKHAADVLE